MGAVAAPQRLAVLQCDIVQRTEPHTFAAADTFIIGAERTRMNARPVKNRIHSVAHQTVVKIPARSGECLALGNPLRRFGYYRLCAFDYLTRLLFGGHGEHGDVILGHDNLSRAHVFKALSLAKQLVILRRVAYLAAAVHDEPSLLSTGKFGIADPFLGNFRNPPCICRRDKDKSLGLDGGGIRTLDPLGHIQQLIADDLGHPLGNIATVARAGEI